jgi:sensor histidine kinase YesM
LFTINPALIALVAVVIAAFLVFVIVKVVGAHRRQASTGREVMLISVLPKTALGRWSVGLAIAFILFFFLMGVLTGSNPFGFNPILTVVLKIIFAGMPVAVFVTGLTSMIKRKERSVFVLVSMAVGL